MDVRRPSTVSRADVGTVSPVSPSPLARLGEFLAEHPALVLTGAGMSTDSGIPDYRGADGTRRVVPMQHGEFVGSSTARRRYWARSYIGWQRFGAARPNDGHRALARLQAVGAAGAIITQNVDGLHHSAGSADILELHGSLADVVCLTCQTRLRREDVQRVMSLDNPGFAALAAGSARDGSPVTSQIRPDGDIVLDDAAVVGFVAPLCPRCGDDTLKPDVVFFGGSVPAQRVARAYALTEEAPALLVLGSSLAVMSGLRFVRRAAQRRIPVAILTRGPTRGDDLATIRVDGPLTPSLVTLADALAGP